jgi:hypothetical protein
VPALGIEAPADRPSDRATITGPQADINLSIATFLNGALVNAIQIDTSAVATDTIAYVATDSAGITATSTPSNPPLPTEASTTATSSPNPTTKTATAPQPRDPSPPPLCKSVT